MAESRAGSRIHDAPQAPYSTATIDSGLWQVGLSQPVALPHASHSHAMLHARHHNIRSLLLASSPASVQLCFRRGRTGISTGISTDADTSNNSGSHLFSCTFFCFIIGIVIIVRLMLFGLRCIRHITCTCNTVAWFMMESVSGKTSQRGMLYLITHDGISKRQNV
jgi:hypothetical protein